MVMEIENDEIEGARYDGGGNAPSGVSTVILPK